MGMDKMALLLHRNVLEATLDHSVSLALSELTNTTLGSQLVNLVRINQRMHSITKLHRVIKVVPISVPTVWKAQM